MLHNITYSVSYTISISMKKQVNIPQRKWVRVDIQIIEQYDLFDDIHIIEVPINGIKKPFPFITEKMAKELGLI